MMSFADICFVPIHSMRISGTGWILNPYVLYQILPVLCMTFSAFYSLFFRLSSHAAMSACAGKTCWNEKKNCMFPYSFLDFYIYSSVFNILYSLCWEVIIIASNCNYLQLVAFVFSGLYFNLV